MGKGLQSLLTVLVLNVTLFSGLAFAFSSGNVGPACNTMYPLHLTLGPQEKEAPYAIIAKKAEKGTVSVTLTGDAEDFRGFILQARDKEDKRVGRFTQVDAGGQILKCGGEDSAVSHSNSKAKNNVTMIWKPEQHRGVVTFLATVVQRYDTFWTGIKSPKYNVF